MKFKKGEKRKIYEYLMPLVGTRFYGEDIDRVKKECFYLMGFEIYDWALDKFSLELFNGFLSDEFSCGPYKIQHRFRKRHDDKKYLDNKKLNPNYKKEYWLFL